jgi:hypothetical protein
MKVGLPFQGSEQRAYVLLLIGERRTLNSKFISGVALRDLANETSLKDAVQLARKVVAQETFHKAFAFEIFFYTPGRIIFGIFVNSDLNFAAPFR